MLTKDEIFHAAMDAATEVFGADPAYFGDEGKQEVERQLSRLGYTLEQFQNMDESYATGNKEWHEDNHRLKGYKWSIQAKYGTVDISEDELFNRVEFSHITEHEYMVSYAMSLGWRYNVDTGRWYRIKGH